MSVFCSYHPGVGAAHSCPKCKANFCHGCITKRKTESHGTVKDVYLCPKCNVYTNRIASTQIIVPFWQKFPQIFQYPLHLHPLLLILILSFIQFVITASEFMSLIGVIPYFISFGLLLTYANLALFDSSHGSPKPPDVNIHSLLENFTIVFKQLGIYILLGLGAYQIFKLGFSNFQPQTVVLLLALYAALAFFLLPAMFILLAITKSFLAAIMPHAIILLAWRIGWAYLGLCFFLILLALAPGALIGLTAKVLPPNLNAFLAAVAGSYYMIVSYHLMGYVLFQYHERVGYKVELDDDALEAAVTPPGSPAVAPATSPEQILINQVTMYIKDGEHDRAMALIEREHGRQPLDPVLADRYFNLLKLTGRNDELPAFGRHYMGILKKGRAKDKITDVYLTCKTLEPGFLHDNADALFMAARALNESGHYPEAIEAFKVLTDQYPDHPLAPNAYYFAARLLNEQWNDKESALGILEYLMAAHPFHENASLVGAYLKQLKA